MPLVCAEGYYPSNEKLEAVCTPLTEESGVWVAIGWCSCKEEVNEGAVGGQGEETEEENIEEGGGEDEMGQEEPFDQNRGEEFQEEEAEGEPTGEELEEEGNEETGPGQAEPLEEEVRRRSEGQRGYKKTKKARRKW